MVGSARARIGRAVSGLVILFLAMDVGGKLFAPELMIATSPPLTHTLSGVYPGALAWTGLALRDPRVAALLRGHRA